MRKVDKLKLAGSAKSGNRATAVMAVITLSLVLSACANVRENLGLVKNAPDEFTVVTKAPLIVPPDFTLRPPQPGAPRPVEKKPTEMARAALVTSGKSSQGGSASQGEGSLLKKAGAEGANSDIRQVLNRENAILAEDENTLVDKIMFWRTKEEPGTALDAREEKRRLQDNAAQGKPVNEGEVPVIKKKDRGIFN